MESRSFHAHDEVDYVPMNLNVEPPVFPSIERVDFREGRQLLVVTAQAGSGQPYSYRGHAYRRVGNTSRQLSREEYNRILLERLHGD